MDFEELIKNVEDEALRSKLTEQFTAMSSTSLRTELETTKAELREAKADKRRNAYKTAGLSESAFETFDSLYDGELSPDKIREAATAKGFALADASKASGDPAQARSKGEATFEQVIGNTMPTRDPSVQDEIDAADAAGDLATGSRLRAQMLTQK